MREISVFLSSPTDVEHERLRAERVVERLNGQYAAVVRLTAIRWEQKFYEARTGFQEQIPEASKCDLVIGILWSRLGSELPSDMPPMPSGEPYPSGTAYEVLTAIEQSKASGRPSVYLFRKTAPTVLPVEDDAKRALVIEQLDRLKAFWERWIKAPQGAFKAGYQEFSGPDEFESQLEALLHAWLDERVLKGRAVVWPLEKGSPFRGLAAFGAKHAPVFFGRGNDITRGVDALKDAAEHGHPFLLLIGPSGAGKSSLARAGLSPRLTTPGVVPVVDQWRVALMRPGERKGEPVLGLALHLFDGPKDIPAEEEGRPPALPELGKSSHKTPQILAQALGAGDAASVLWALDSIAAATRESEGYDRPVRADLLLIVDQLDELFAADVEEEEREAFAKALAALVATGRVWVIATLRTDLYERLQQDPVLLALKQSGSAYDLAPPGAAELAEIVRKPAEAAGLTYERDAKTGKSLDEQLLEDAGRPDMLPLVQFALQELFDRREVKGEDTLLTFAAYTELGGLDGAIDKRAETAIASLGEAEKAVLPRLLRQLAVPARDKGGEATLTIRSVPLSEAAPDEPTKRLVQALIDARILLSSGDEGTPSVRLAHERVLKSWKRAADIVRENEDFYRIRANVEEQLARWKSAAQSPDLLIPPGLPLEESRKLITGYGAELEPGMRSYIDASLVEDDKRVRGRRLRYRLAAAAAVIFACVAVFAGWQWWRAGLERDRAEHALTVSTDTANGLIFDLAQKFRDVTGVPASLIKDLLGRARKLQDQLISAGEVSPALRRSQYSALSQTAITLLALGDTNGALQSAKQSQSVMQALLQSDPKNVEWQRGLAFSYDRVGDVLEQQGDLVEALKCARDSLALRNRLIMTTPDNDVLQGDLPASFERIGHVLAKQGKAAEAMASFRDGLAIRERLAKADPNNADRQFSLALAYSQIGRTLVEQDNRDDALKSFRDGLTLIEHLTGAHPENARWQFQLALSRGEVGDVLWSQGMLDDAQQSYQGARDIINRLARGDPGNTEWQAALSASYGKLGNLLLDQFKLPEAVEYFSEDLAIIDRLAKSDPDNARWQRELAVAHALIGSVRAKQGRPASARAQFVQGRAIITHLKELSPDDAQVSKDLAHFDSEIANLETPLTGAGERALNPGDEFRECASGCPLMIVLPAGTFMMGGSPKEPWSWRDSEHPQHEVTIAKAFAVGKYELTFAEWDACVAAGGCSPVQDNGWGRGELPVINVSWEDAQQYLNWLTKITGKTYRLLSEAEWEYAARGEGTTIPGLVIGEYAWFQGNSYQEGKGPTHPVGQKKANSFGLFDIYGNVWEWVEDVWHDTYTGAPSDGSSWIVGGEEDFRVRRGGAWSEGRDFLHPSTRVGTSPTSRRNYIGLRVARAITP